MEDEVTFFELIAVLAINSLAVIAIGIVIQLVLLSRVKGFSMRVASSLGMGALAGFLSLASTLVLCFVFPGLIQIDLGSFDLDETLRFMPAWLGTAIAIIVVTSVCVRIAHNARSRRATGR